MNVAVLVGVYMSVNVPEGGGLKGTAPSEAPWLHRNIVVVVVFVVVLLVVATVNNVGIHHRS